jgi:hypothetical protein
MEDFVIDVALLETPFFGLDGLMIAQSNSWSCDDRDVSSRGNGGLGRVSFLLSMLLSLDIGVIFSIDVGGNSKNCSTEIIKPEI